MPKYKNSIALQPFSKRYTDYYIRCFSNSINCLEGAYRAGKSVINVYSFANYLDYCKDRIHLVTGASSATARLNVSDLNGFGLSNIFDGRCKTGKYEGNDCLKIKDSKGVEKIVIFVGGGFSDSYKKIQGLSFGSWLSVELANLYISDDEKCFIDMAISRLTQSHDQKIWWDLNPTYPTHKVYSKYLDRYEAMNINGELYGGFNFMKCSLFDNTSLSESQRKSMLTKYPDVESMEYQRYILGNRACAEGLIFSNFAKDSSKWVVTNFKDFVKYRKPQFVSIGVDFGGNGSNTTFVATIINEGFRGVFTFKADMIDMSKGDSDTKEFNTRLKKFINEVNEMINGVSYIKYIFGDCADVVMVNEIRNVVRELRMADTIKVMNSCKHTIKKRIDTKKMMLTTSNWFILSSCTQVINSTSTQVWNNKVGHEDERLDDGTCDIDTADAEEYSWSAFLEKLLICCN